MRKGLLSVVVGCFLLVGFSASGHGAGHGAGAGFIEQESINGILVMTGGMGIDEREQMKAMADPYNLKLEFAVESGSYLAGVSFSVETAAGDELMKKEGAGPWAYLDLSPGSYVVKAWRGDELRAYPVEVARDRQTVILHWN